MIVRFCRRTLRLGSWVLVTSLVSCGDQSGFVNKEVTPVTTAQLEGAASSSDDAMAVEPASGMDPFSGAASEPGGDLPVTPVVDPVPPPPPVVIPDPVVIPEPVLIVSTAPVVLTAGQTRPVAVSIDHGDGSGAVPADPSEIAVISQNPGVATVTSGPQPGQIVITAVNPGTTQVSVTIGNTTSVIPVQVAPGVPVIRLGVNFEDIPSGGDLDYNDAVFCFSGKFAHDNHSVISLDEQAVRINVTNRSGCDHDISIAVVDSDGTRRQLPIFRSRTQPVLDMVFHAGSKLDVQMHVADGCLQNTSWVNLGSTVAVQGPNFGRPLVEILNDVCRTTGN
jgi:hypothetical protein